jgi:hypothetical protein
MIEFTFFGWIDKFNLSPSSLQITRILGEKVLFPGQVQLDLEDLMKGQHLYQQQSRL